jgi:hypothetical protein
LALDFCFDNLNNLLNLLHQMTSVNFGKSHPRQNYAAKLFGAWPSMDMANVHQNVQWATVAKFHHLQNRLSKFNAQLGHSTEMQSCQIVSRQI